MSGRTESVYEQRERARAIANERRLGIAALKSDLQSGRLSLADVLIGPHELADNIPLADIIRWPRRCGHQGSASLEQIGREAIAAGVNLMLTAGRASAFSRAWVAEHGERRMSRYDRR